ncbi:hypothetical protein [Rathayibacter soli]|uniref:hypothetical protein n=1 Tax=Rathayibacter soli TaxID=3144168 RepID=UPI0027E5B535|nr:hypothetical protein [Glaciibacter superstes]
MLRIRKTRWKVAYIVVAVVLATTLNGFVFSRFLPTPVAAILSNAVTLLLYFGGARSFRGAGEPVEPPRAWWRMTARPTAGLVIGSLLTLSVTLDVFGTASRAPGYEFSNFLNTVVDAVLVVFYVHSSIRLVRSPPQ